MKLHSLPLFPLGAVLYPGGQLALQVFEVRYLDMMGRCHKTGAPFGVVLLTQGSEVRQPGSGAAFKTVGTLARLRDLSTTQPGLMQIHCEGVQRFQIERQETLKHGLWIADVTLLADDLRVPIPDDLRGTATALRSLIHRLQARQSTGEKMPAQPPYHFDDCAWVSNRWCELLPIPLDLRQRMLELDNPLVRLELVNDILERTGIGS